jgi:hypothetical protein
MSHNTINHTEIGIGRRATQYYESAKFIGFLEALLAYSEELEIVLDTISLQSDIDIVRGVNLDTIGEIVGISRIIPSSLALSFFGFPDNAPPGFNFGEEGDLSVGARFREELEPATASTVLADPEYRQLIRAKIIKNHSKGTGEDLINGLNYLFNSSVVIIEDNYDMSFDIAIGRNLTFAEKALLQLDILPRPMGVKLNQKQTFIVPNNFGFADQINALGFREEGAGSGGGLFSEEF